MRQEITPSLTIESAQQLSQAKVAGTWLAHLLANASVMETLQRQLTLAAQQTPIRWDLSAVTALDHIGAQMLWTTWGKKYPPHLIITPAQQGLFTRLEEISQLPQPAQSTRRQWGAMHFIKLLTNFISHMLGIVTLLGQLVLDIGRFIRHPMTGPWKELSANVYRTGFQALGITALVGSLIGVVLSYLSAQQLRAYGGDLFLVNLLGMSIVRELGPMLAAILVAGRSGSAITAQLGVMRVTEELDAMQVMGIPVGYRLIMPKVLALAFTMPMIVIWTDVMALLGGMLSAHVILDMSPAFFIHKLPDAVSLANYWIGLGKGAVFGVLISVIACHYGLRIKANTESLGQGTTSSVVMSITVVIIADAIFAIIFSEVGF